MLIFGPRLFRVDEDCTFSRPGGASAFGFRFRVGDGKDGKMKKASPNETEFLLGLLGNPCDFE